MNNKGYTLVEILAVIVLIGVIAALVVTNLDDLDSKSKKQLFDSKLDVAIEAAKDYGQDNISKLSNNCTEITIGQLISKEYLNGDDESGYIYLNPVDNSSMNNYIFCITINDGKIEVNKYKDNSSNDWEEL